MTLDKLGCPQGHAENPLVPVTVEGLGTMCGCPDCVSARQEYANRNCEPLIEELDSRDEADFDHDPDWHDIGGEG